MATEEEHVKNIIPPGGFLMLDGVVSPGEAAGAADFSF
jgi:hypothetical protein